MCTGFRCAVCNGDSRAAQAPGTDKPKFEVASVRENTNDDGKITIGIQPGGRFTAVGVPLVGVDSVWRSRCSARRSSARRTGPRPRASTSRPRRESDIQGTPPGGPPGPLNFMLQDLLEDRFKLRAHRETRELPIYALTLARTDRKLGAGLRASTVDCAAMRGRGGRGRGRRAAHRLLASGRSAACGRRPEQMVAGGMTLAQMTPMLSQFTQRIVVDRTGLTGTSTSTCISRPNGCRKGPPPPGGRRLLSIRTAPRCSRLCRSSLALSLSLSAPQSKCSSSIMLNGRRLIRDRRDRLGCVGQ